MLRIGFWNPTALNCYDNLPPSLLKNIRLPGHEVSPCHSNLCRKSYMTPSVIHHLWRGRHTFIQSFSLSSCEDTGKTGSINSSNSRLIRFVGIFKAVSSPSPKRFAFPSPSVQFWQQDFLSSCRGSYPLAEH